MAGNNVLLDTNIMVAILNKDKALTAKLENVTVYVSSIVLGELYFGAYKSAQVNQNLSQIERYIKDYELLVCDKSTAEEYGQIKAMLRAKGRPIPENDIWIAAQARQYSLPLITRDEHFKQVDGLLIERW
jgi:tRNA(fMet)-specific endonuclease VapC